MNVTYWYGDEMPELVKLAKPWPKNVRFQESIYFRERKEIDPRRLWVMSRHWYYDVDDNQIRVRPGVLMPKGSPCSNPDNHLARHGLSAMRMRPSLSPRAYHKMPMPVDHIEQHSQYADLGPEYPGQDCVERKHGWFLCLNCLGIAYVNRWGW